MLVAVPLGRIADRFGRKVVFYSSIFGSVAALLWTLLVCMSPCTKTRASILSFLVARRFQSHLPHRDGTFVCHLPSGW